MVNYYWYDLVTPSIPSKKMLLMSQLRAASQLSYLSQKQQNSAISRMGNPRQMRRSNLTSSRDNRKMSECPNIRPWIHNLKLTLVLAQHAYLQPLPHHHRLGSGRRTWDHHDQLSGVHAQDTRRRHHRCQLSRNFTRSGWQGTWGLRQ